MNIKEIKKTGIILCKIMIVLKWNNFLSKNYKTIKVKIKLILFRK